MSTGAYIGLNGSAKRIKNIYLGVGNVAKKIKKAYIGVDGTSKLWWSARLAFGKIIDLPSSVTPSMDPTEHGFYFSNNGSYLISTNGSGRDYALYINANDVVGSLPITKSSEFCLVGSSGAKVWYMTYSRSDVIDGFCYIDNNLVLSSKISYYAEIDYNNNYGGGSRNYKHLGSTAFFHIDYPDYAVILTHENGTVSDMVDVFSGFGGGSYASYVKVSNYLIRTPSSGNGVWSCPVVNISNGVVQQSTLGFGYACGKADDINGTTIVACGSPANSETRVYAIQSNLTYNELTVPDDLSSLPCGSYECVPYNNKFYFYSTTTVYESFSVDLNYMFEIVENPSTVTSRFYNRLGYDVFNGNLYLGLGNSSSLTGLLKGS